MNRIFAIGAAVVIAAAAWGYILNIIALTQGGFDAGLTVEAVLRIVGIFAVPLGVIMGLFV